MANYNKVILVGNLTRDPELKEASNGTSIAKLGMAVNRRWRSKEGEEREETTFVDVDAFGRQAEIIGQHLKKGRAVMVEGRLRLDQWEDKQSGKTRSKLGVVLEHFQFMDQRGEAGGAPQAAAPAKPQSPASMTYVLKAQLEQIEARIKAVERHGYEDAWGLHIPDKFKEELKELKQQKKTVCEAIRGVAVNG